MKFHITQHGSNFSNNWTSFVSEHLRELWVNPPTEYFVVNLIKYKNTHSGLWMSVSNTTMTEKLGQY